MIHLPELWNVQASHAGVSPGEQPCFSVPQAKPGLPLKRPFPGAAKSSGGKLSPTTCSLPRSLLWVEYLQAHDCMTAHIEAQVLDHAELHDVPT